MIKHVFRLCVTGVALIAGGLTASLRAQTPTNDHFTVSELKTDDYGSYFTISLDGSERLYTAYNMTIKLPIGMTFATENGDPMVYVPVENTMYPTQRGGTMSHSVSSAIVVGSDGREARVICSSNKNENLKAMSGELVDVYVDYNAWVKAGENTIILTGLNLTANDPDGGDPIWYQPERDLNTGTVEISGVGREVDVNITAANKVGTVILPFGYTLPAGVTAYLPSGVDGDVLTVSPAAAVEAYKPYILYAPDGFSGTLVGDAQAVDFPDAAEVENLGLCGVIVPTQVESGFILQNQGAGVAFYRVGATPFALKAGRCYYNGASGSNRLKVRIAGSEGIDDVIYEIDGTDLYYDLNGRAVETIVPGRVYINGNQKIIKTK